MLLNNSSEYFLKYPFKFLFIFFWNLNLFYIIAIFDQIR